MIGECDEQVHLDSLYREGKAIDITTNNGYKHVLLYFPDYPWPHVAYSQTYMADNNNLIVYDYPLSKVVIDYSFLYLVYFVAAYAMRKVFRTTDYLIVTYWRSNNKQSDVDLSLALYLHLQLIDESVKITFYHI
ncbi:hypothetical protein BTO00_14855 [Vibrio campbellii]|nr:hypothetical protein BTO00_14855 [Vibrio campbellii]